MHTVKETVRAIVTKLTFEKYPPQMIVEMKYNCVFWLYSFSHWDRVHETLIPMTIMTGQRIRSDKSFIFEFGAYIQIHEKHNNSMQPKTSGAIALKPSGNKQSKHYFLCIHTVNRVL